MKRADIERYLDRGDTLGFVKETGNKELLGWIVIYKLKPNERILGLLEEGEMPEIVTEQESWRAKPYFVKVIEMSREIYESEAYETYEDLKVNDIYHFLCLDDVDAFLQTLGNRLENIKWPIEIGMP